MKTSVKLTLAKTENKEKLKRICLRLTIDREYRLTALNYAVLPENWDKKAEKILKGKDETASVVKTAQSMIDKKKVEMEDLIVHLERTGELEGMSPMDLIERFTGKKSKLDFQGFTNVLMIRLQETNHFGNYTIYKSCLSFVNTQVKDKSLPFESITYKWLVEVETAFIKAGNSYTTLSIYLRTLRAIFNLAIKEKLVHKDNYPFDLYTIKSGKAKHRAIDKISMELIESVCCIDKKEELSRKVFLLMFYLRGINFWDLCLLTPENITEGRINYTRAKTHKDYSVNTSAKALDILAPFVKDKDFGEYLFPFVTRTDGMEIRKDIENARHTFNKWLKFVGTGLEIKTKLTGYVSRHSYATIAKKAGLSMAVISESLGHAELKTTQIYMDSFESVVLDEANKLITG